MKIDKMSDTSLVYPLAARKEGEAGGGEGSGAHKLSDAAIEIARPVLERANGLIEARIVIILAVKIWNLLLLPMDEHQRQLAEIIQLLGVPSENTAGRKALLETIQIIRERRLALFPDDPRAIVEHHLIEDGGKLRLNAIGAQPRHRHQPDLPGPFRRKH